MTIAIIIVGVVFIALTWWIVRLMTRPPTGENTWRNPKPAPRDNMNEHSL